MTISYSSMSTELALPQSEGARKAAAATYKILIIGDSNVGKTSLLNRYCDDSFTSGALIATVGELVLVSSGGWLIGCFFLRAGIDYKTKHIELDDETVKLQIWWVETSTNGFLSIFRL